MEEQFRKLYEATVRGRQIADVTWYVSDRTIRMLRGEIPLRRPAKGWRKHVRRSKAASKR